MQLTELYSTTLTQLTALRSVMLSPAWQAELDKQTQDDRVAAGNELIQVGGAILALSNASLSDIAEEMQANETQLAEATKALEVTLSDITKVQNVISAVSKVLAVVAKIIPLIA